MPYPVEVFEMELLEDGISTFQLVPPHGPQVWQQLVPLLSTEPVRFASLGEGKNQRPKDMSLSRAKESPRPLGELSQLPPAALDPGDAVKGQLV